MEKRRPSPSIILPVAFCILFGALMLFLAYTSYTEWTAFKQTALQTDAVITNIKTQRSGSRKNRHTTHTIYVEYTVDGQTYSTTLDYWERSMRVGDIRSIYYDPANPEHSMSNATTTSAIMGVIGAILLLTAILLFSREMKKCSAINRLIEDNKYYLAEEWEEQTAPVTVNNVRYHNIKLVITDDRGTRYTFTTPSFHPNKSPYQSGDKIKVYVDFFEDPNNFYISKIPVRD